jgi:hypothetical protein
MYAPVQGSAIHHFFVPALNCLGIFFGHHFVREHEHIVLLKQSGQIFNTKNAK